jgi:hypothetical protein
VGVICQFLPANTEYLDLRRTLLLPKLSVCNLIRNCTKIKSGGAVVKHDFECRIHPEVKIDSIKYYSPFPLPHPSKNDLEYQQRRRGVARGEHLHRGGDFDWVGSFRDSRGWWSGAMEERWVSLHRNSSRKEAEQLPIQIHHDQLNLLTHPIQVLYNSNLSAFTIVHSLLEIVVLLKISGSKTPLTFHSRMKSMIVMLWGAWRKGESNL